jgi:hypothetical protein
MQTALSFVMIAQIYEDEMQNALRTLTAHAFSLSETSGSPRLLLVSHRDEKVFIGLTLTNSA